MATARAQGTLRCWTFWKGLLSRPTQSRRPAQQDPGGQSAFTESAKTDRQMHEARATGGAAASFRAEEDVAPDPERDFASADRAGGEVGEGEVRGWWSGVEWGDEAAATTSEAERRKAQERWRRAAERGEP